MKKWRMRFRAAYVRRQGMRTLLRAIRRECERLEKSLQQGRPRNSKDYERIAIKLQATNEQFDRIKREWEHAGQSLNTEYPKDEGLVLPTRLGNTIRSFEDYPYR